LHRRYPITATSQSTLRIIESSPRSRAKEIPARVTPGKDFSRTVRANLTSRASKSLVYQFPGKGNDSRSFVSSRRDSLLVSSTLYRTARKWKLSARYVQPRTRLASSEAPTSVPSMTSSLRSATLRNLLNVSISFRAAQRALPCSQMIDHPLRGNEARLDSSHGTKPDKRTT